MIHLIDQEQLRALIASGLQQSGVDIAAHEIYFRTTPMTVDGKTSYCTEAFYTDDKAVKNDIVTSKVRAMFGQSAITSPIA